MSRQLIKDIALTAAAREIDPSGERVAVHVGDIVDPTVAKAIVERATERFGGVDVLFNNAGVFRPKPFLDLDEGEYDWFLDTLPANGGGRAIWRAVQPRSATAAL